KKYCDKYKQKKERLNKKNEKIEQKNIFLQK
ncbi:MAG: hypothetical protein H6Q25_1291, partial [Bacteroidetes bacterium]|nr:hypothetical protein [Bacteroidota bacterium]